MVVAPLLDWVIRPIPRLSRTNPRKYASSNIVSYNRPVQSHLRCQNYREWSSTSALGDTAADLEKTRNIGIIAHIDAGKTTTTERMLYYSGFTRRIGDVDEGSTVTDFLPAERARGITIQSAAITFHWPPPTAQEASKSPSVQELDAQNLPRSRASHTVNLIDTPGHADFTFEVLRSLRILDGAVTILDGVAGVEAQTEKVWHQASVYQIPRIVYVNKLDRDGAAFGRTVREVGSRLQGWPAVCQIPWFEGGNGRFTGIADVVTLQGLLWKEGGDGKSVKVFDLANLENEDKSLAEELKRARIALIELLSEHDEDMVEKFFDYEEDHLAVPPMDIIRSLRKCLLGSAAQRIIPVFAGSSFRNMGVQPLLDAVNNLLPGPSESSDPEITLGNTKGRLGSLLNGELSLQQSPKATTTTPKSTQKKKLAVVPALVEPQNLAASLESCALAFKVVSDPKRGVLVYVRVYSGSLNRGCNLYNTNLHVTERVPRLFKMYANDAVEVESIHAGHIGVVVGLKYARTGDTLITTMGNKATPPEPLNTLQLRPIDVPPPVFFASIEPHSLSEEKNMQDALALLLREDPSLHVTVDEDSGQTLLSGMGELHLEIARDRLVNDFKAKASMGRIEIGYRECPLSQSSPVTKIFDKEIAGRKGKAGCTAVVEPFDPELEVAEGVSEAQDVIFDDTIEGNRIIICAPGINVVRDRKGKEESSALPPQVDVNSFRTSLFNGALSALARGPQFTFPMHSTKVTLICNVAEHLFGSESSASALSASARLATQGALRGLVATSQSNNNSSTGSGTAVMEPVMNVIISVDEGSLGAVVHDISSARGGHIVSLDEEMPITASIGNQNNSPEADQPPIDINKIYAPPDPFETPSVAGGLPIQASANQPRTITAKVPLKEMVGYLKHLRSLSAGRGTFVMNVDRFERMSTPRQKAVLSELNR
ncbi:Ribosome-releasing factor 2, mitochondrial [Talaromyces atroroseus]|uniref:Ribosome-releasing factor 2, mitochondrial n=1 Tax=Talaromyces atroroseus TaxID=1441469 RepID=A0A225AB85_TALAT|nr:Ribosome-releasing factor 2, mitochondrial [Talaromyces atroroseus]OKL57530.1 Ribosome-releasing factor 2, mitochondrial [Talaromyces atroroseus]